MRINFAGEDIIKPGYYGYPWWDKLWRMLKREHGCSEEQIDSFLKLTDTLIRLDLHSEGFWRGRNVK